MIIWARDLLELRKCVYFCAKKTIDDNVNRYRVRVAVRQAIGFRAQDAAIMGKDCIGGGYSFHDDWLWENQQVSHLCFVGSTVHRRCQAVIAHQWCGKDKGNLLFD